MSNSTSNDAPNDASNATNASNANITYFDLRQKTYEKMRLEIYNKLKKEVYSEIIQDIEGKIRAKYNLDSNFVRRDDASTGISASASTDDREKSTETIFRDADYATELSEYNMKYINPKNWKSELTNMSDYILCPQINNVPLPLFVLQDCHSIERVKANILNVPIKMMHGNKIVEIQLSRYLQKYLDDSWGAEADFGPHSHSHSHYRVSNYLDLTAPIDDLLQLSIQMSILPNKYKNSYDHEEISLLSANLHSESHPAYLMIIATELDVYSQIVYGQETNVCIQERGNLRSARLFNFDEDEDEEIGIICAYKIPIKAYNKPLNIIKRKYPMTKFIRDTSEPMSVTLNMYSFGDTSQIKTRLSQFNAFYKKNA